MSRNPQGEPRTRTGKAVDPAKRLAALREVIHAAHGDWHEATALWSVQADIDWLLSNAEAALRVEAAAPVEGLREALEQMRREHANHLYLRCDGCDALAKVDAAALRAIESPAHPETGLDVALRAARKSAGKTLRALAADVGADFTYLSKIEHGHDRPSADLVARLDAALVADGALVAAFDSEPCPRCGRTP